MLKCYLIRHSMTYGNTLKRYIGITDESLCPEGIQLLKGKEYPRCERLYASPLKRCIETAEIIYPGQEMILVPELGECNFGEFENKNYMELSDNPNYQRWIDSNGMLPFPGGESREDFQKRSVEGFRKLVHNCIKEHISSAAFVVHGGTIMSIMEVFARPHRSYYECQINNGEGFELELYSDEMVNYWKLFSMK